MLNTIYHIHLEMRGHAELSSTYLGPPNIFDTVNILAHSSSASTTARAWWISLPTATTPWLLIITALRFSPPCLNASETRCANSAEPDGLFDIITGFPTTIFASSIMCWNLSITEIAIPSVYGLWVCTITFTVVVTNHQTQRSVDGAHNRVVPFGGNHLCASKYRVHLDYRSARLELGPCPPPDISFAINERGFTDVADD